MPCDVCGDKYAADTLVRLDSGLLVCVSCADEAVTEWQGECEICGRGLMKSDGRESWAVCKQCEGSLP